MPTKPVSKLKRLPPKKRPRKAKAGSRGSAASESVLTEISGEALVAKEAIEKAGVKHTWFVTGEAHEWQAWRKDFFAMAPMLFQKRTDAE